MKYRPLSLPRVPAAQQLTANLLADPVTPVAASLIGFAGSSFPSLLRRARFVQGGSHFSYVSPLTLGFPYEFPPQQEKAAGDSLGQQQKREMDDEARANADLSDEERHKRETDAAMRRMDQVESALRAYEVAPPAHPGAACDPLPRARRHASFPSARLLGFSPEAHAACLPHLDVGDTREWIARSSGRAGPEEYSSGPIVDARSAGAAELHGAADSDGSASAIGEASAAARRAFSEWVSGRAVRVEPGKHGQDKSQGAGVRFFEASDRAKKGSEEEQRAAERDEQRERVRSVGDTDGYAPWSMRYGGDQFGEWAGQLGDGRAVTLLETVNPSTQERWEVQLKGAGRTPYSRFGDGLATLGSSVREFLACEYLAALGIPTSRALCVVGLPDLPVRREELNSAAVTTRIAGSWLRVGNFQIHSRLGEWESVRMLGEFVAREIYGWKDVVKGADEGGERPPWAERLIREVAKRNAVTFARWQAYGFMHGVLNTDNISLLGDTIDFGPYGFMDLVDQDEICNHSDYFGRYSYRMQPTMALFAIERLVEALAPVLGFEDVHGRAPRPCELLDADAKQRSEWADHATATRLEPIREELVDSLLAAWKSAWRERLGLVRADDADKAQLVDPLLEVLKGLDLTTMLRRLCAFPAALQAGRSDTHAVCEQFARDWIAHGGAAHSQSDAGEHKHTPATEWLERYATRLLDEARPAEQVERDMLARNPRFLLRNWITYEVGDRLERKQDTAFLERVRQMCARPFDAWGEGDGPEEELAEQRRLCEVKERLSSHLPSCSS